MFKDKKVRDIAVCQDCNFLQIITAMFQLNRQGLGLSKTEQKERFNELETCKTRMFAEPLAQWRVLKPGEHCDVETLSGHTILSVCQEIKQ